LSRSRQTGSNACAKPRKNVAETRIDRHSAVVEQDLPDIYTFIAEHDPAAAERVLDAVEETFRQLARHPDCGVPYATRNRKTTKVANVSGERFSELPRVLSRRNCEHSHPLREPRRKTFASNVSARIARVTPLALPALLRTWAKLLRPQHSTIVLHQTSNPPVDSLPACVRGFAVRTSDIKTSGSLLTSAF